MENIIPVCVKIVNRKRTPRTFLARLPKGSAKKHCVWIGAGAIVLPGVSVGENAVTHDAPANTVVAGNPAKVIKRYRKNPTAELAYTEKTCGQDPARRCFTYLKTA